MERLTILLAAALLFFITACEKNEAEFGSGNTGVRIKNETGELLEDITFTFNYDGDFVAEPGDLANGITSLYYQFEYADWCNFRFNAQINGEDYADGYWICGEAEPLPGRRNTIILELLAVGDRNLIQSHYEED